MRSERLKLLAKRKGISLNKLIEEWSTVALTEFDAETRFRLQSKNGDRREALAVLDRLDRALRAKSNS